MISNSILENIKNRRSCRSYKAEQITDDELQAVLEAGTFAPTSHGQQDPTIVAVQQPKLKEELTRLNARIMDSEGDPFYAAPTLVFVFASKDNKNAIQDGSCVMQNMMLAAESIGLATCWINREIEMFQTPEGEALLKELGLPTNTMGIAAISLGYKDKEGKPAKPRRDDYIRIIK